MLKISDDLSLPLDAATQTFAFIARKGAGKTYAASKLTELLLEAKVQVIILDPVGNWYGLRIDADGKGKGFEIPVFGGLRGDLPLQASAGELVADVAVETGQSLILDVSQFSLADRKRFATSFGERLWKNKKAEEYPTPLMLVLEEAQLIVPQFTGASGGEVARMLGIYEEIIRLGRNYGIGVMMISQRPQSVNKEVLNQAECLFVLQVNGAQERKSLKDWIVHQGMDSTILEELPSLPVGTAYVWSPQWLGILKKIRIAKKEKLDASATPEVGDHKVRRNPAPLDLSALEARMAATIEQSKQNDPRELKNQIAALKKQLAQRPTQVQEKPVVQIVEKPILRENEAQSLADTAKQIAALAQALTSAAQGIQSAIQTAALERRYPANIGVPTNRPAAPPSRSAAAPAASAPRQAAAPLDSNLGVGERKILKAVAQYPDGASRDQLTVLTGYKRSSRDKYLQLLAQRGYVETGSGSIQVTAEGIAALGTDYEQLPTGEALREYWMAHLTGGEKAILQVALDLYPEAIERSRLEEMTNYKRSSRDKYIQKLMSRRLVTGERGAVRASNDLF